MAAMLELDGIRKKFGAVTAVDDISLAAGEGEFVVLLGPSGCGKSTLLRIVAGLEAPDRGRVLIGGVDVTSREPRDRDLAMVFQSYALYPHMTVFENIAYPLRIRKLPPARIAAEAGQVARKLGLEDLLDRRPKELSGGQRQRVALARAMVRRPKAFLMDEPLSNLDARLRVDMRAELKHLQHELRTVTLYVTHDQAEAMTLAHRIAVIHQGRLLQYDTPANVYHRPANRFVAGFVGSPAMNLIEGDAEGAAFVCPAFRQPFPPEAAAALGSRSKLVLGVRPEDVEVSLEVSLDEQPAWHAARVYVAEEMGNETVVRLSAGSVALTARVAAGLGIDFDATVWFRLNPAKLHWFDAAGGEAIR